MLLILKTPYLSAIHACPFFLAQAALNATASATGYDVTVKPVGDWTNKTFDQAQKGQLNPQNPIGNSINQQVQMNNFDPNDPSTYPK